MSILAYRVLAPYIYTYIPCSTRYIFSFFLLVFSLSLWHVCLLRDASFMQTLSSSSARFSERERELDRLSSFLLTHVLQGYKRRHIVRTFRTLRPAAWPAPLHQPHGLTHQFTLYSSRGTIGPRHSTEVLNVWKTSRQFEQTKKKKKGGGRRCWWLNRYPSWQPFLAYFIPNAHRIAYGSINDRILCPGCCPCSSPVSKETEKLEESRPLLPRQSDMSLFIRIYIYVLYI